MLHAILDYQNLKNSHGTFTSQHTKCKKLKILCLAQILDLKIMLLKFKHYLMYLLNSEIFPSLFFDICASATETKFG